ncbi:MAG: hypothetical protein ACLRWP_03800 [Bilophila wadsworthia]
MTACLSALDVGVVASLWSKPSPGLRLRSWPAGGRSYPLQWGHAGSASRVGTGCAGDVDAGWRVLRRAATDGQLAAGLAGHCSERIMSLRDKVFEQTLAVYAEAHRRRCSS